MKRNKFMLVLGLIVVASMVLAACGTPTQAPTTAPVETEAPVATEAPTEAPVATEAPTEEPRTTRVGGWLDEIVFTAIADPEPAISQIQAGAIDVYPVTIDDATVFETVKADPKLGYSLSYGSFNQLMFNPVACTDTTILNPFSNAKIREAMNWAVDRDYIVQEILGGLGTPRYTVVGTTTSDYARYAPVIGEIINKYAFNLDKAKEVVAAEMEALGATLGADGKWAFNDAPVSISVLIRTEDKRKEIGDYFANQLEQLNFAVVRDYKTRSEASPIWTGDPYECKFNVYTAGWISTAISRDEGNMFAQYNTGRIQGIPLFNEYKPSADYDVVLTKLQTNDFKDMAERDELFAKALPMSMEESWHGLMINDGASFSPKNADIVIASDLAAGMGGTSFWPYTIRWAGKEGGTVKIAQSGIMVEPWNPLNGSNWIDDSMIQRGTQDWGAMYDPYTGLGLPQRVSKAVVTAEEGLPIRKELAWVDLNFVPVGSIKVPGDAWVDWDAVNQKWITAAEKYPDGITAKTLTTVFYPTDLYKTVWHDGSPVTKGDFINYMIMNFDPGKEESKLFDEDVKAALDTFLSHFKGVKVVSTDPLIIETYDDLYYMDAEWIAASSTWYPNFSYGPAAWHALVPSALGEAAGEIAWGQTKSLAIEKERTSLIAGPSLEVQKKYLDQAAAESYIPFAGVLGSYITKDEADLRYKNLLAWYEAKKHLWVGSGPYFLDQVFPVEGTIVLKHNPAFIDLADKWSGFGTPMIASAVVEGAGVVKIGEEAAFDVLITFADAPYPNDKLASVTFLLYDANGAVAASGDAVAVEDGKYQIVLGADVTGKLVAGSNMLSVAVSSSVVAIPSFATIEFVTQ